MLVRAVDLLAAVLVTALEAGVLVAFWFVESLKAWAAQGRSVPGATSRLVAVLSSGSLGSAAAAYGFFRAGLPATAVSQVVAAGVLSIVLAMGLATEAGRWVSRLRRKRARRG